MSARQKDTPVGGGWLFVTGMIAVFVLLPVWACLDVRVWSLYSRRNLGFSGARRIRLGVRDEPLGRRMNSSIAAVMIRTVGFVGVW